MGKWKDAGGCWCRRRKVIKSSDGQRYFQLAASRPMETLQNNLVGSCFLSVKSLVDVSEKSDADNQSTLVGVGADFWMKSPEVYDHSAAEVNI